MSSPDDGDEASHVALPGPINVAEDAIGNETSTEASVEAALRSIVDPCSAANGSNLNVVEMGLVDDIQVMGGHVVVDLLLTTPACDMVPYFHESIEARVGSLEGIDTVEVQTDHGFEWTEEQMTESAKRRRVAVRKEYAERHRKKRTDRNDR